MPVESTTTIPGLNDQWPLGSDPKSEGDNHIRMIKEVMQNDALSLSAPLPIMGEVTIDAGVTDVIRIERNAGQAARIAYDQDTAKNEVAHFEYTGTGEFDFWTAAQSDNIGRIDADPAAAATQDYTLMTYAKTEARYLQIADAESEYLPLTGGALTGALSLDTTGIRKMDISVDNATVGRIYYQDNGVDQSYIQYNGSTKQFTFMQLDPSTAPAFVIDPDPSSEAAADETGMTRAKSDERYAQSTASRSLFGYISAAGSILSGTGFTCVRTATGTYTITFDVGFGSGNNYAAVATPVDASGGDGFNTHVVSKTSTVLVLENRGGGGSLSDTHINFIVMG